MRAKLGIQTRKSRELGHSMSADPADFDEMGAFFRLTRFLPPPCQSLGMTAAKWEVPAADVKAALMAGAWDPHTDLVWIPEDVPNIFYASMECWSPRVHFLYHSSFRNAIRTIMEVHGR